MGKELFQLVFEFKSLWIFFLKILKDRYLFKKMNAWWFKERRKERNKEWDVCWIYLFLFPKRKDMKFWKIFEKLDDWQKEIEKLIWFFWMLEIFMMNFFFLCWIFAWFFRPGKNIQFKFYFLFPPIQPSLYSNNLNIAFLTFFFFFF